MADKQKTALGPVGETLRENLKRIREGKRLTYMELSNRLAATGRPIPVLGLRRIERGERRVDVDDLVALAAVLAVSPVDLMVPGGAPDEQSYGVTPEVSAPANLVRGWISGRAFLARPSNVAELAEAIRWMPEGRAQMVAAEWLSPGQRFGYFAEGNSIGAPLQPLEGDAARAANEELRRSTGARELKLNPADDAEERGDDS